MLKLWFAGASPFARKVRIVARETGLTNRIEEVATSVSPVAANETLARDNPLIKVPSLVTDAGVMLYDSRVICEYLDGLHQGARLFPQAGDERFTALRRQALGDGMLDAAVLCRYEHAVRPEALRWADWSAGQKRKIFGGLDALEADVMSWQDQFNIGQISAACVLGYLDFRFAEWGWREQRPRLERWFETAARRPSMQATLPPT